MYAWAYLLAHWSPLWEPPTFEERLELGQLLQRAKAQATTVDSFEDALLKVLLFDLFWMKAFTIVGSDAGHRNFVSTTG